MVVKVFTGQLHVKLIIHYNMLRPNSVVYISICMHYAHMRSSYSKMTLLTIDKKSGSISKSQVVSICRTLIQCQKNANIEYLNLKKVLPVHQDGSG